MEKGRARRGARAGVGVGWSWVRGRGRATVVVGAAAVVVAAVVALGGRMRGSPEATPLWGEGEGWWVAAQPVLDLTATGEGPGHVFAMVRDVLRIDGGRVAVADAGSGEVLIYDSDGRLIRAHLGKGEGPGELGFLASLAVLRDGRLVAQDLDPGGRIVVLDADSGVAAASGLVAKSGLVSMSRRPEGVYPVRQTVPSDFLWGVRYRASSGPPVTATPRLERAPMDVIRLSLDDGAADSVTTVPGPEMWAVPEGDLIPLMGRDTHVVPYGVADVVVGTADSLGYVVLDGWTGAVRSVAGVAGWSLRLSAEAFERERRTKLGPDPNPDVRRLLMQLPRPAEKPAYERLVVDSEGHVWAGEFLGLARRYDARRWFVWDGAGVWLGTVRTPPRFELMSVTDDELLGVYRDDLDVEHPRVLQLRKPSRLD